MEKGEGEGAREQESEHAKRARVIEQEKERAVVGSG